MTIERDEQLIVRCPICRKPYQLSPVVELPTCGDPLCIREARARGLPFATKSRTPTGKRITGKKRTKGKKPAKES